MPAAGLTKEGYIQTILDAIAEHEREQLDKPEPKLRTKLILSVDRRNTLEQAYEVLSLATRFLGKGVVGIDLCGDPAAGSISSLSAFTPVFQKARTLGLGVTVHFAEAECSGTDAELQLLLSWQPDRLGHVICVSDTMKQEIKKREDLG
ncbi:adenosine deaminase-like protein [Thermochaetoides thermophila DSM 1495]|uniref:Adenosine deaminase-like protein n=1 Tax=Chaetomium thermophilum (strain DSM 1495 / CBS 144.50 / IMI 039719) TaxID=759272 RepID=G0S6L0_CHATD|nr:adenosine deaminase-like protein [Thermochaetoides thermophila DSM 1495]EGS20821.1 adenosine deaminase-like protein [Thermochaetoides thermophila DSM 1495]